MHNSSVCAQELWIIFPCTSLWSIANHKALSRLVLGCAAIPDLIFYLVASENLLFDRLTFWRLACFMMSSTRRSMLPDLLSPVNHDELLLRTRTVIESMLELIRISRTISPILLIPVEKSSLQLNYYILSTVIGALFCKIFLSRSTIYSLP